MIAEVHGRVSTVQSCSQSLVRMYVMTRYTDQKEVRKVTAIETAYLGQVTRTWVTLGRVTHTWVSLGRVKHTWVSLGRVTHTWVSLGQVTHTWGSLHATDPRISTALHEVKHVLQQRKADPSPCHVSTPCTIYATFQKYCYNKNSRLVF